LDRVQAVHPNWSGHLLLSPAERGVQHEGHDSRGVYALAGDVLTVTWDDYPEESFLNVSGVFVHEQLVGRSPNLPGLFSVELAGVMLRATRLAVVVPGSMLEVQMRLQTSDPLAFQQVFVDREYDTPNLPEIAATVVDLGANIGFASLFFALRYPQARILAVEPEDQNFAILQANTAALGSRIRTQHAAAWISDGFINLHTEDAAGAPLGNWGVQVSESASSSHRMTPCYRLATLLDRAGFDSVDVLKVDIEGAELELFSHQAGDWLDRVRLIIVETHDRFRPGSEAAVRAALHPMFEELPPSGENLMFRRL